LNITTLKHYNRINKMKNSEILELSTEELVARIGEEKANITKLKFAHAVSAIENPTRITKVRKDIARLNTELTKRKAAPASEKE
jgi:large subunit ribosomal protein L29